MLLFVEKASTRMESVIAFALNRQTFLFDYRKSLMRPDTSRTNQSQILTSEALSDDCGVTYTARQGLATQAKEKRDGPNRNKHIQRESEKA